VPFDNVRKLIHVKSGKAGPLPGGTAEDFFTAWLRHGTGGTCWHRRHRPFPQKIATRGESVGESSP